MIQYKLNLESETPYECYYGDALQIHLDGGHPRLLKGEVYVTINYIEVYVSETDSEFRIVGTELNGDSYVSEGNISDSSNPANDPGRFLGWKREGGSASPRTLTLRFRAPESYDSTHRWELSDSTAPPPAIKVRVKRQQFANNPDKCDEWDVIE
jgi:hypothetical protein